uniref:Tyr recombinase domain-containing protein n=1 Tax=Photinus pyralis TaxID=7054 RepID=A0A1Y1LMB9_PHOPY
MVTLRQYDSGLKRWWTFCDENKLDVFRASPSNVLSFMALQFERGVAFGTLNSYRAAIGQVLSYDLGNNALIKKFFKGVGNIRPNLPKYNYIWDPAIVLDYLAGFANDTISLENLGKKLAVLLALATGHRVQTLSNILVEDILVYEHRIEIKIPLKIKTSARNRYQPTLLLPFFIDKPSICVASALQCYVTRSKVIRLLSCRKLFLTHKKPIHNASSQTISRWIKEILSNSGLDTNIFSAHSTRHAATSAAARRGISIDTIRTTASWSAKSNTFARFYQRPVRDLEDFAGAVFNSL